MKQYLRIRPQAKAAADVEGVESALRNLDPGGPEEQVAAGGVDRGGDLYTMPPPPPPPTRRGLNTVARSIWPGTNPTVEWRTSLPVPGFINCAPRATPTSKCSIANTAASLRAPPLDRFVFMSLSLMFFILLV
jgi:hypothetical protein